MKKILIILLLSLSIPASAEYLFLKDGAIIKCKIVDESVVQIVIKDEKNEIKTYKRENILRVLFTELNMEKLNIQLKNGESIKAYMIDEDRDSYTFRKVLNKPEEIQIKRSDVLFMTERNPSSLKGEPDLNSIDLTWFPPFDKMKKFNIYIKKKKEDKYKIAGTSGKASYTIDDLPSNTVFFIKVTGVDFENIETSPSNEIEVLTKNQPPEKPGSVKMIKDNSGDVKLLWKPSIDRDGKVIKYQISKILKSKKEKIGDTDRTEFTILKTEKFDQIIVDAVDDRGSLSSEKVKSNLKFLLQVNPGVIFPFGVLGEMSSIGFGSYLILGLSYKGFQTGLETGFFYFPGNPNTLTTGRKVNSIMLVPMLWTISYRIHIVKVFGITPSLSGGYSFLNINGSMPPAEAKNYYIFDPMAKAGLSFEFRLNDFFSISFAGEYGLLFEKSGVLMFAGAGINCIFRL
jgi:hypothetical protein